MSSTPNKLGGLPFHLSPWHELLTAALALSRVTETEMDRALAIVPLRAREFAALFEIAKQQFPGGFIEGPGAASADTSATDREPVGSTPQRRLAHRLALGKGATSDLLARLERRGLIERRMTRPKRCRLKSDQASIRGRGRPCRSLRLTSTGLAVIVAADPIARGVENAWAARLAERAHGEKPPARAAGLARWLSESVAALTRPGAGA